MRHKPERNYVKTKTATVGTLSFKHPSNRRYNRTRKRSVRAVKFRIQFSRCADNNKTGLPGGVSSLGDAAYVVN